MEVFLIDIYIDMDGEKIYINGKKEFSVIFVFVLFYESSMCVVLLIRIELIWGLKNLVNND